LKHCAATTKLPFHFSLQPIKMPSKAKAKRGAVKKNESLGKAVLEEETALLGRTIKKLGNKRFRILTTDSKGRGVEVEAHVRGNTVFIQLDDIVVLGSNESAGNTTYEILGSCDKKIVKQLSDKKRLHSSLVVGADELGDDLFDRGEEDAPVKQEEEDVDVDAI
jgi:hypothetical protein